MSLPANEQSDEPANKQSNEPVASTRRAADPRRARARFRRIGLAVVTLLGTGVLTAACAVTSSRETVSSGQPSGSPINHALAFVNCMRTHGEPNMPDPVGLGHSVQINITVGSGVNPRSRQFRAAVKACKYLVPPGKGSAAGGQTITPAQQADYLRAVACMRSHGFPKFPDPAFQGSNVSFNSRTPIDANSAQFKTAVAICDKLIPAGLPYSGRSPA